MTNFQFNFDQVITVMGERLIVLDMIKSKAVWLSIKFSKTFPELSIESTLDEVFTVLGIKNEIFKHINSIEKNTDSIPRKIQCSRFEAEIYRLDKSYLLIRINNSTLVDEANGRYLEDREKLIYLSRSITVSEMASTIAHEINQPVGTINNLLQGIRDRITAYGAYDPGIIKAIDNSIQQAQYTADIISRIRDYTSSRQPKIKKIDLNNLIDKCISLMDWEVRNTNVKIQHNKHVKEAMVKGDELMLQQVVVNIIRNSIESIENNEKLIVITTKNDDNYLKITIKDNGKGITDEELETIFIPFTTNKSSGMGIGLNICRSFVEMHRGKIWMTQNNDKGCTSHILLPNLKEGSI